MVPRAIAAPLPCGLRLEAPQFAIFNRSGSRQNIRDSSDEKWPEAQVLTFERLHDFVRPFLLFGFDDVGLNEWCFREDAGEISCLT